MRHTSRWVSLLSASLMLLATGSVVAQERDGLVLALGDSVAFGYITQDGYAYVRPENFRGYPEHLAHILHMDVVNAACPGEATTGFLSKSGADNGCDSFKANFPLHVSYEGASTQLVFATTFLNAHRHHVRLVTLQLGANDGFLLESACSNEPTCISAGLPEVLAKIAANLATIIADLRATGYTGQILLVNYYSTNYADPNATALVNYLNSAIGEAAAASDVPVVNLFKAFQTAASAAGGNTCLAGLLNVDPTNSVLPGATCDVHPAQSGQALIARTVARKIADLRW